MVLLTPGILSSTIKSAASALGGKSAAEAAIERSDAWTKDPSTAGWLRDVYKQNLGRDVGEEGLNYWGDEFRSGKSKADIERDIGLSNEKWLNDTYKSELGRDAGDEGRSYWLNDMKNNAQTRDQVLANIRRSPEWKKHNESGTTPIMPTPEPEDPDPKPTPTPTPSPNPDWKDMDWGNFAPTLPEYEINDGIDAVSSAGNRMTDHFYSSYLPKSKANVDLGTLETGAALHYHQGRTYKRDDDGKVIGNKLNIPDYQDPKEMFNYFYDKLYGNEDNA
jgi:hypothetical protein